MAGPAVCVVGASNLDLISYVPRLPRLGETLHWTRFRMGFGGKGANQAVMAAKLGAAVTMVTKLGRDVFGDNTRDNFRRWGIDMTHVLATDAAFSGVAPIAVDPDGHNAIIVVAGANDLLTPEEVEQARPAIGRSRVLVCQLEVPLEASLAALRIGRAEGLLTILNPAPARADLPAELYALIDVLCPHAPETELLAGMPVRTLEEAAAAAARLLQRGPQHVILTLGERGCLLTNADGARRLPATSVQAVDTTGAGDAFVGSLAFYLATGTPLPEAAARANRIAGISVQALGTQSSFPDAASLPAELQG